jgi:hypothetical protein
MSFVHSNDALDDLAGALPCKQLQQQQRYQQKSDRNQESRRVRRELGLV